MACVRARWADRGRRRCGRLGTIERAAHGRAGEGRKEAAGGNLFQTIMTILNNWASLHNHKG